jgi:tetratricopeptide (TPR) repeat protein
MSLGDLAAARRPVQALLAIVNSTEVLLQDGLLKLAAKDFLRARISLEEVVKVNPEDLRAVAALCETYVAEKQLKACTDRLREIAGQRPKYVPLQMFWANWLLHNGDKHEARKTLYAAKAADPQNTDPDLLLARIAYAERDIEAAHRSLAAVISRHPTNAEAQMLEGMTDEVSNDFTGAIEHYKKVVETNDHHVGALNNLAYVLSRNPTTLDEALKHAQKARELSPENPYIQDTLGWIYYRKGLYTMAVKELEGALAGQVTPAIQFHLGLAYKTVGKVDKSKQLITAALAADPRLLQDSLP